MGVPSEKVEQLRVELWLAAKELQRLHEWHDAEENADFREMSGEREMIQSALRVYEDL